MVARIVLFETVVLLLTVFFTRPWQFTKDVKSKVMLMQIVMVAFSLIMMTGFVFPIYEHISSFRKLQFPWRYLTVSSSLVPYLASYTVAIISEKCSWLRKPIWVIIISLVLLLTNYKSSSFILRYQDDFTNDIDRIIMDENFQDNERLKKLTDNFYYLEQKAKTRNTRLIFYKNPDLKFLVYDVYDYLPTIVSRKKDWIYINKTEKRTDRKNQEIWLPKLYPPFELVQGKGKFSLETWGQEKRNFQITVIEDVVANLRTYYYPGWAIEVTPTPNHSEILMSAAQDGRIQLKLPRGNYQVKVWYRGTLAERFGSFLSLVSLFLLGCLLLYSKYCQSQILADSSDQESH